MSPHLPAFTQQLEQWSDKGNGWLVLATGTDGEMLTLMQKLLDGARPEEGGDSRLWGFLRIGAKR